MTPTLPHRFRESSFRFYEPFLAHALNAWPSYITVEPGNLDLSSETFGARLRDARLSYKQNKWPSQLIDPDKFDQYGHLLQVSIKGRYVLIGSREALTLLRKDKETADAVKPNDIQSADAVITKPFNVGIIGQDELTVLAKLASERMLKCPIQFMADLQCKGRISALLAAHDIDIKEEADHYILT